jgi:hypothetical protein
MNRNLAVFFLILAICSLFAISVIPQATKEQIKILLFVFSLSFSFASGFFASRSKKLDFKRRVQRVRYYKK